MRSPEPFDAFLQRYRGLLFHLCRRYSRHGVEVDDLMQEMAIALWRGRERMPEGLAQAGWVWRVARNAAIDTLRRTPQYDPLPEGYDKHADYSPAQTALHEAVGLLAEPDKTITTLFLQGYKYEEIAERCGLTVSNVSVRLVRVKEKLRKLMTD